MGAKFPVSVQACLILGPPLSKVQFRLESCDLSASSNAHSLEVDNDTVSG